MKAKIVFVLLLLFLLAVLLSSGKAHAAVALDDTSHTLQTHLSTPDVITWSHTCTGTDLYLIANVIVGAATQQVDSVKYNGVLMDTIHVASAVGCKVLCYGMSDPPTGAHDIAVYLDGLVEMQLTGIGVSYTGVDQATPFYAATDTMTEAGSALTENWSGPDADDWIHIIFGKQFGASSITPGASQTFLAAELGTHGTQTTSGSASYKVAVADNNVVSYTSAFAGDCVLIAFALTPHVAQDTCCTVYTSPLAFGNVTQDNTKLDSFYVYNCGDSLLVDAVEPSGLDAVYSLVETDDDTAYSLGYKESKWFHINFTPAAVQEYPSSMVLGHDSCGTLTISGTGVAPPSGQNRVFYMSPTGNNSTGDGSRSNPYLHLSHITENVLHPGWGDTVMVMSGTYAAEIGWIGDDHRVRGHPDTFMTIMADPLGETKPVFDADSLGIIWFFTAFDGTPLDNAANDVAYIRIQGLSFTNSMLHGLSIDDGGSWSRTTPAHHIVIEDCDFSYSADTGQGIKLAGVDTFLIKNCTFSEVRDHLLDLVGCHWGTITGCSFENTRSTLIIEYGSGIQIKGGSANVLIDKCYFHTPGYAGMHIGQVTGEDYFRPIFSTDDGDGENCDYEVKNIDVYRSIFVDMINPIKWASSVGGGIYNCTFYCPEAYDGSNVTGLAYVYNMYAFHTYGAFPDTLVFAKDGEVINNIMSHNSSLGSLNFVVYTQSAQTNPESFLFSYNLWHDTDDPGNLPAWDYLATLYGSPQHNNDLSGDPLFVEASPEADTDFMLQSSSPAVAAGSTYVNVVYDWYNEEYVDGYDYNGIPWDNPRSLGAYAGETDTCCYTAGIAFGNVYVDSTATDSFRIWNCGLDALEDSIHNWGLPAVYVLAEDSSYTIASGDTQWFTVEFTPTAAVSYPNTFDAGAPACADIIFSGLGVANTCCQVTDPAFFGQVTVDATATDSFYIYNCGYVALVDSIDWDLIPQYVLASDSIYNIAAGDTVWFVVEFTPTAEVTYRDTIDTGHADCYNAVLWGVGNIVDTPDTIETFSGYKRRKH